VQQFMTPEFWLAVGQIIMIDILLGGDNAVVIALACRKLPPKQRTLGILWGTAGAITLRVILIFFALTLLQIPFLKIVGAVLLLWIGIKLLMPEHEEAHSSIEASDKLWAAVKTVIVADFVMSLDNVIAIAGAAQGAHSDHHMPLVIFGLLVSVPIIVWGSQLVIKLMDRFPVIITLGGMLLGWIAGQMVVTDPVLKDWMAAHSPYLQYVASALGALFVLLFGKWLAARARAARPAPAQAAAAAAPQLNRLQHVLLAVDGSENSAQAVRYVIGVREDLRHPEALDVHLLNVQRPVSGEISRFVPGENLKEYHLEGSEAALAPARALLDAAGLKAHEHRRVGDPASTIAEVAKETGSDLVVMGTRGLGGVAAGLIGSVAQATVAQCGVPVLLVK
jgi:YjbE family integral membrane protein